MSDPVKRRGYVSPLRAERARRSRSRIVAAAIRLFLADGYARTTIAAVAAAAGVSADLVFHLFGSKRELLRAAMDASVGGDDRDVPFLERAEPQAMRRETDQRRQIAMFAAGMAGQLERVRPVDDMLRNAAAVDPQIAVLREDIQLRQRRQAMTTVAGWLRDRGPFRGDMPVEQAAAVIWTLTSPEVHHMLTVDWAWTSPQYQDWLRTTLQATLLPGLP